MDNNYIALKSLESRFTLMTLEMVNDNRTIRQIQLLALDPSDVFGNVADEENDYDRIVSVITRKQFKKTHRGMLEESSASDDPFGEVGDSE